MSVVEKTVVDLFVCFAAPTLYHMTTFPVFADLLQARAASGVNPAIAG